MQRLFAKTSKIIFLKISRVAVKHMQCGTV